MWNVGLESTFPYLVIQHSRIAKRTLSLIQALESTVTQPESLQLILSFLYPSEYMFIPILSKGLSTKSLYQRTPRVRPMDSPHELKLVTLVVDAIQLFCLHQFHEPASVVGPAIRCHVGLGS